MMDLRKLLHRRAGNALGLTHAAPATVAPSSGQPAAARSTITPPIASQGSGDAEVPGTPSQAATLALAARMARDLIEVGVALGQAQGRAAGAACALVRDRIGIDLEQALGEIAATGSKARDAASGKTVAARYREAPAVLSWLEGRNRATCAEILSGALHANPHDHALRVRVGKIMAACGWRQCRPRSHGGRFVYLRPSAALALTESARD